MYDTMAKRMAECTLRRAARSTELRDARPRPTLSARRERPHRWPSEGRAPERTLEAARKSAASVTRRAPLGRRLLPAAPGGEPETADGAPVAVGRLPVEAGTLEVGDFGGEAEDERRPLAVDRGIARPRARVQARGHVSRQARSAEVK